MRVILNFVSGSLDPVSSDLTTQLGSRFTPAFVRYVANRGGLIDHASYFRSLEETQARQMNSTCRFPIVISDSSDFY